MMLTPQEHLKWFCPLCIQSFAISSHLDHNTSYDMSKIPKLNDNSANSPVIVAAILS